MFITVVDGKITHRYQSIVEVADSMRVLDPFTAFRVEVFECVGNGNDILKARKFTVGEGGEGITPTNLEKYKHRYP